MSDELSVRVGSEIGEIDRKSCPYLIEDRCWMNEKQICLYNGNYVSCLNKIAADFFLKKVADSKV